MSKHRFDHSVDRSDDTREVSSTARPRRIEVITSVERRRKWSAQEKAAIVKLLWWDGSGLCLLSKRLESSQFRWPRIEDGVMRLSAAQLSALVEGLDWARVAPREVERPRAAQ